VKANGNVMEDDFGNIIVLTQKKGNDKAEMEI
jgi:hypothetical protein